MISGLGRSSGDHSGVPGFPLGSAGKESTCSAGDLGSIPGWEDPLKKGYPFRVFWPGEFHGLYSPRGPMSDPL